MSKPYDMKWAELDGARFCFSAERTPRATVHGPDRTISREAADALLREMSAFVLSRLLRAMLAERPPQRIDVHVYVELDGESAK